MRVHSAEWEGLTAEAWQDRLGLDRVELYHRVDSTSDVAAAMSMEEGATCSLVLAEEQTGGRGRRGRTWHSPPGLGLWFTMAFRLENPTSSVAALLAGLGVSQGIAVVVPGFQVGVKWPNDLMLNGKKVAGVLCEIVDGRLLVGIGVNVNQGVGDFPPELGDYATSLSQEVRSAVPRGVLLIAVVSKIRSLLDGAGTRLGQEELVGLRERNVLAGQVIEVTGAARTEDGGIVKLSAVQAEAHEVSADGALVIRLPDSRTLHLVSGTLRGAGRG